MTADELRIGDAEREQTMAALREHFALGRLDHDELDQRLDRALAAKTARDLAAVTADLPSSAYGEPARQAYAEPSPSYGPYGWQGHHDHMKQLHQMKHEMRHRMRDERRAHRHGRRGPGPIAPILLVALVLGIAFGGFGFFKVLFFVWIVAMVLGFFHRRSHYRRTG